MIARHSQGFVNFVVDESSRRRRDNNNASRCLTALCGRPALMAPRKVHHFASQSRPPGDLGTHHDSPALHIARMREARAAKTHKSKKRKWKRSELRECIIIKQTADGLTQGGSFTQRGAARCGSLEHVSRASAALEPG